jgi:hypothetical protein
MKLSTTSLALLILLAASRTYHQKHKKRVQQWIKNGGRKPLYIKYIGVSRIVTRWGRRLKGIISKLDYIKA